MVVLATKVYGDDGDAARHSLEQLVHNDLGELEVEVDVGVRHDGFPSVTVTGPDAVAARNLLAERWGEIRSDLEPGRTHRGTLEAWSTDAWRVDAGRAVEVDADDLGLGPGDAEQVATRFGLVPHVPVSFVAGDPPRLADAERDRLYGWRDGPGRVNANGVTRAQFRATINRAGHADDVVTIERLGLLEHSAVCTPDTDPPGLLASIGSFMPGDLACVV